jgi:glutamate--cysteine ligase
VIPPDPSQDLPIGRKSDLFGIFRDAEKPRSEFRVGVEAEKFAVFEDGHRPMQYDGEFGVRWVLGELATRYGWLPATETEGGPLIALTRDGASITLEPGGQVELSGAPHAHIHAVVDEIDAHRREVGSITDAHCIAWLGVGFHPFAKRTDLTFVPKVRYGLMRNYLPTRGDHALDMMLRTCTVQANFDYADEADAMRKLRVGLKLSPLTTAIFANSPWVEGAPYGGKTFRGRVWLDVDPDRSGLLPWMWPERAGYDTYVEWALDVPMFLLKRGGKYLVNTGQTFRNFWKNGFEGHFATLADWQLHLNTLFPEVRLKRTIEIRGADMQGTSRVSAVAALWTGIYYDDKALAEAEALTRDFTPPEALALREVLHRDGLQATFRGKPLAELAARVVEVAKGGLTRRHVLDGSGSDETVYLADIERLVASGKTPADELLDGMKGEASFASAVIRQTRLSPRSRRCGAS